MAAGCGCEFFGGLRAIRWLPARRGCSGRSRGDVVACLSLCGLLSRACIIFLQPSHLHVIDRSPRRIRGQRFLAIHDLLDHLIVGKFFDDFFRAHVQRAKRSEARIHRSSLNFVGMQLQIDPAIDAHGHHLLHIAGTWTKRQTVERMYRALLIVRAVSAGWSFFFASNCGTAQARPDKAEQPPAGQIWISWRLRTESSPDYEPLGRKSCNLRWFRGARKWLLPMGVAAEA